MGHCSSIALGIALSKPDREVVCIDGDGSMLMHLGSLTSIASLKPKNFRHILMNNEVHESVGGQVTAAKYLDLSAIIGYQLTDPLTSRFDYPTLFLFAAALETIVIAAALFIDPDETRRTLGESANNT